MTKGEKNQYNIQLCAIKAVQLSEVPNISRSYNIEARNTKSQMYNESVSKPFAMLCAGVEVRASRKISLDGHVGYDTTSKWNGEIGMRYTF